VIIKVEQCGICGSDLGYIAMGGLLGPGVPMRIGHELSGTVIEAGDRTGSGSGNKSVGGLPELGTRFVVQDERQINSGETMNNSTNYDYSGAKVLVTGGTSGIGYGIATAFTSAGAQVTVTGTRASPADYDDVELSAFTYKTLKVQDTAAIKALAAELDGLDILVNNAGASMPGGDEWTHEGFEESIRVNLLPAFHMSQACFELLKASEMSGGANIIGVASLTSFFANELVPGYGAAKAGLVQMAKSLGLTWAQHGIRANNIAAGMTDTRMTGFMKDIPEFNDPIIDRTPLKRWGSPQDMAGAVLFLCSEQASFITGQTLTLDGGYTLGI
jgi:NAD(P)-dependent dehydrogenase (short-subunit alcohol dehydrogenase family)